VSRSALGSALVLIVTVVICFSAGELCFRLIDGYKLTSLSLIPIRQQEAGSTRESDSYAARTRLNPSFHLDWYNTNPRDYDRSNNYPLPRDWIRAVRDYKPQPGERAFIKNELKFLYNYNWLVDACKTDNGTRVIKHYRINPGFVYAFKSPDASTAPQFRLVPRGWNEGEDSYNNFGFRGPDINPAKSSRTIRIAFIGASTTAQGWPFTYPEYAVHFLQLWANAERLNVHFDVINAGRPGLDSLGIAKIMRYEVAPLHPDLVVYDPGANDFNMAAYVKLTNPNQTSSSSHGGALPLQNYSALLGRVYELIFRAQPEGRTPEHTLTFDFKQANPNLNETGLPFRLNEQIVDAKDISEAVRGIDGHLFVTSFIALPYPGLRLDPERDRLIIDFINQQYWPLTFSELRDGFNFQNNVYRELANRDGFNVLDVARYFPQDPNLFSDVFHFRTQSGERLEGWIAAQLLAPYVRREIVRHELPKPAFIPAPGALAWARARPIKFNLACLRP